MVTDADIRQECRQWGWPAGKGDSPRNLSKQFRKNYDGIAWGGRLRPGQRVKKVYGTTRK